jgi:hypothetical protein
MATVIALPGYAVLADMPDGKIVLAFDGATYTREDIVSIALLTLPGCPALPCTAGTYVAHCMTQKYGSDRRGWPPLAHEFVGKEI